MTRLIALIILAVFAIGCDDPFTTDDQMIIEFHQMDSPQELVDLSGNPNSNGFSEWGVDYCDIYMMHPDRYGTKSCYVAVLNHELRHCREGKFHGDAGFVEPECGY